MIGLALGFIFLFLVLPLAAVFTEAFRKGLDAYFEALKEPDAWSAIRLTLLTAFIAVPLNLVTPLTTSTMPPGAAAMGVSAKAGGILAPDSGATDCTEAVGGVLSQLN